MTNNKSEVTAETKLHLSFLLNGESVDLDISPSLRALDVLRDELNLTGTKEGCGVGECGACTVLMDGIAVSSCMVPAFQMNGKEILTVEGLADTKIGSVLQRCFIECDAVQCGFCTPGMLISSYALLHKNLKASRQEIREAIAGNLCRCTGYVTIVDAIEKAGKELSK